MDATRAADLELIIGETPMPGQSANRKHPVQATSPHGPAWSLIDLDLSDPVLTNVLKSGAAEGPTAELRKEAGQTLFDRLFQGETLLRWTGSLALRDAGQFDILRIRLWFRDPALAALPWELLYNGSRFLATDAACTLSRYLPGPEPAYLAPVRKLRVLAIVSRPTNVNPRIPDEAVTGLQETFDKLGGNVDCTLLENPDLADIQAKLGEGYHVLHYLGHGVPNELLFTKPDGAFRPVAVENLRQLAVGHRELRLVVLNACGSAQASGFDVFAGVGPGFVQIGVPAVVAMQYRHVDLKVAEKFNVIFYPRLVAGAPVDVAVSAARQAISVDGIGDRGWSTPVLYVGTRGSRVIELTKDPSEVPDDAWSKLRQAAGEVEFVGKALDRLEAQVRDVSKRLGQIEAAMSLNDALQTLYGQADPLFSREGQPGQMLAGEGWAIVQAVWPPLAREALVQLEQQVEVAGLSQLWLPRQTAVKDLHEAIDAGAMKLIPSAIAQFHGALDAFDIDLRHHARRLVRETADAIQATLGRG